MKMFSDKEIKEMNKLDLQKNLMELQVEYIELDNRYDDLDDCYSELENDNCDMADKIDELESQAKYIDELVDMDYLKEKLELYGFKTEKLFDFLDLYMRLYNK